MSGNLAAAVIAMTWFTGSLALWTFAFYRPDTPASMVAFWLSAVFWFGGIFSLVVWGVTS